jgi:glycosyltransferase involved in cell wall biosynthesis
LVEDGSPDGSWEAVKKMQLEYPELIGLKLSRNFGQHAAIFAGLKEAKGEWVVVMDCDLQDDPLAIPALLKKAKEEKVDKVLVRREIREDSFFKRLFSKIFYRIYGYLTNTKVDSAVANFGLYHRKVITAVLQLQDKQKAFPLMVNWVGFKAAYLNVKHKARFEGKSSYNWTKLIQLATDIALSFSQKPILLTVRVGMVISILSMLYGLFTLFQYFTGAITVLGYTSLIVSIWFLSGLIIFFLGMLGMYVARIFEGVKDRPVSIIAERTNGNE